jgi:hypothetical protein
LQRIRFADCLDPLAKSHEWQESRSFAGLMGEKPSRNMKSFSPGGFGGNITPNE